MNDLYSTFKMCNPKANWLPLAKFSNTLPLQYFATYGMTTTNFEDSIFKNRCELSWRFYSGTSFVYQKWWDFQVSKISSIGNFQQWSTQEPLRDAWNGLHMSELDIVNGCYAILINFNFILHTNNCKFGYRGQRLILFEILFMKSLLSFKLFAMEKPHSLSYITEAPCLLPLTNFVLLYYY